MAPDWRPPMTGIPACMASHTLTRVRLLQRDVREDVSLGEVVWDRGVIDRPDELDRSIEPVRPRPACQPVSRAEPRTDKAEDSVGAEPPHFAEGPDQAGDVLAICPGQ